MNEHEISQFEGGYHLVHGRTHFEPEPMPCRACGRVTQHATLHSVYDHRYFEVVGRIYDQAFQVVKCQGCQTLSFRYQQLDTDDIDEDPETGDLLVTVKYYPPRMVGVKEIDEARSLPSGVRRVYQETISAVSNEESILAGMGLRALVEAVCKNQGAPHRSLHENIDFLHSEGLLTHAQAQSLHNIQQMGNAAAHEGTAHSQDELGVALKVVNHLLEHVFVMPRHEERLRKLKSAPRE